MLTTLTTFFERIVKIVKNLSKLYDVKELQILNVINVYDLKQFIEELSEAYGKEMALKRLIIHEAVLESRFSRESRMGVLSAWLHEPFIKESFKFRLKSLIDI